PTMVCDMLELQLGMEQAEGVIDALASLVTGCAIALSWQITEEDIIKMERYEILLDSFIKWHQHMHDVVPTNMYSSNMHYLQHIPEMVRLLGPLHSFSARSMERAIGFLKKRIKPQKNPGVNAGNILRRQQACRYYSSLLEDSQISDKNIDNTRPTAAYSLEFTDEEFGDPLSDDVELWDHSEREVEDYSDVNLRHYLVKFWRRKFPDDRIGWNDINNSIIVGRRLYMNEVVYDAMKMKRKTDKLCHFVKLDIEVDRKKARRNTPKDLQIQSYFGEAIMYFAHEYNGNTNRFTGRYFELC
ncbi:hypothetical protein INT45_011297, partial [Circinella minor]